MSLSKVESFEVSTPSPGPGFSRLFRQRIRDLDPKETIDRERLKWLCGTASAANQFLDKASKAGVLIPTGWGEYRLADDETLALIARVGLDPYRQFISWHRHLPDIAGRNILFVAPFLWAWTDLNIQTPMPLAPLGEDEDQAKGLPPQWEAFYMDVDETLEWNLVVDGDEVGSFQTPGRLEVVLLLRASLNPRWRQAANRIEGGPSSKELADELGRMNPQEAPRGSTSTHIGLGPPHRRRFLAPPWFMDMIKTRLSDAALSMEDP